ncbi:Hypothetical protein FKW44_005570, partial [Caligus rogercresseyi]
GRPTYTTGYVGETPAIRKDSSTNSPKDLTPDKQAPKKAYSKATEAGNPEWNRLRGTMCNHLKKT